MAKKGIWNLYEVQSDGTIKRKNKLSPQNPGRFLAEHSDRRSCGKTGYIEYKTKKTPSNKIRGLGHQRKRIDSYTGELVEYEDVKSMRKVDKKIRVISKKSWSDMRLRKKFKTEGAKPAFQNREGSYSRDRDHRPEAKPPEKKQ